MRIKFILLPLVIVLIGVLAVTGCAKEQVAPTPAVIEIRLANSNPPPAVFVWGVTEPWAAALEAATNGRMKVIHHNAEALGPAKDHWDLAVTGVADVSHHFAGYSPGLFLLAQVVEIPGTGLKSAVQENQVLHELYLTNEYFQKEFEAAKVLFYAGCPTRRLHTKEPVHTLEDLKGMRIATLGSWDARVIELLGGTPVHILVPEQYIALEKGIVDGTLLLQEGVVAFKLNDMVKHTVDVNLTLFSGFVQMNWDYWNSLPADLQKIVMEVSDAHNVKVGKAVDESEAVCAGVLKDTGGEIYTLPPDEEARWLNALQPMLGEWVAQIDAKGMPGQKILDEVMEVAKKY